MAESNEMFGRGCGCTIRNHGRVIELCPTHKAAPEMLADLETIRDQLEWLLERPGESLEPVAKFAHEAVKARHQDKARGQEVGA